MRLLLDLVAFLRIGVVPERLPARLSEELARPEHEIFVASSTIWEMAIKVSIGKLELTLPIDDEVSRQFEAMILLELPVTNRHALRVAQLPLHHRDPFDRLLVAVAMEEGLTIVTNDPVIARYGVPVLW